jgi:hypothetical protein
MAGIQLTQAVVVVAVLQVLVLEAPLLQMAVAAVQAVAAVVVEQ